MHVRAAYYWLGFGSEKMVTGIAATSLGVHARACVCVCVYVCVCVCVCGVSALQSVLLAIV